MGVRNLGTRVGHGFRKTQGKEEKGAGTGGEDRHTYINNLE